jgi:diaminopimelate decarboxylase
MNDFHYVNGSLWCEGVSIAEIARQVGTPFYIYSYNTLRNHYKVFDEAFKETPHLICFSVKVNSNIAVLKTFIKEGSGLDIVSGGELFRALQAGADPAKIVYSGVGKRLDEIEYAVQSDILMFNVESPQELEAINQAAARLGKKARIAIRINPDVDPKTHPYISTGLKKNKFGFDMESSLNEYRKAKSLGNVEVVGVDCHIGSQLTEVSPFIDALSKVKELVFTLRSEGFDIRYLDLGGGLGITYNDELPPHPNEYARGIIDNAKDLGCTLIFEPGRVIVGNAGVLVTNVLYTKSNGDKNFVIVDAGMNDLIRPSFYGSYHHIEPVNLADRENIIADIVGPICESGDFIAKDRNIPRVERGDLIAVRSAGAYGFTMSSNYNARLRVPEILVADNQFHIIREREQYRDLTAKEHIPVFLSANK